MREHMGLASVCRMLFDSFTRGQGPVELRNEVRRGGEMRWKLQLSRCRTVPEPSQSFEFTTRASPEDQCHEDSPCQQLVALHFFASRRLL